nr:protein terminal ear1 homolog [Ipomoea batatas]
MATSLNPLAQEWRPQGHSSVYLKIHHVNILPAPAPVVGFPAAEVLWPQRHNFYHLPLHQYQPDGGPAAVKKAAPPPPTRRRLPPRLRATGKSKIWRSTVKPQTDRGDSSSPVSAKTTVMIRNIPNQYQRDSFLAFLDEYCLESHLQYDFLYLPMDFKQTTMYEYAFVKLHTATAAAACEQRSKDRERASDMHGGYAFVNFTTAAAAAKIRERLQNHAWGVLITPNGYFTSKKICVVAWARIQGRKELVKHFKQSNFFCSTPDFLPAVFSPPRNGLPDNGSEPQPIGNLMGNNVPSPNKA